MKTSLEKEKTKGISFGLTSGIITTLGVMVGLESSLHSRTVIIAGILSIAIADTLSDAFGMHISEEAARSKNVWTATFYTLFTKSLFAAFFIIPFMLTGVMPAMIFSILFGLTIISIYSYKIAKEQSRSGWKAVGEHLLISIIVIAATHYVGSIIGILLP